MAAMHHHFLTLEDIPQKLDSEDVLLDTFGGKDVFDWKRTGYWPEVYTANIPKISQDDSDSVLKIFVTRNRGPFLLVRLEWHDASTGVLHRSNGPAKIEWAKFTEEQEQMCLEEVTWYSCGLISREGGLPASYEWNYSIETGSLLGKSETYYQDGKIHRAEGKPDEIRWNYVNVDQGEPILIFWSWHNENGQLKSVNGKPAMIGTHLDGTLYSYAWYDDQGRETTIRYFPDPNSSEYQLAYVGSVFRSGVHHYDTIKTVLKRVFDLKEWL